MPIFGFPLALLGLAGLAVLGGIYFFRSRFRRYTVSSLMLWYEQSQSRQGGRRIERFQMPLLFFLELAAIFLLAVAAADPMRASSDTAGVLVVVLDDSYSMLAGEPSSVRSVALDALADELADGPEYSYVRFILAGQRPKLAEPGLGDGVAYLAEPDNWPCRDLSAEIDSAIALAGQLAGPLGRVLVLTDRPPSAETEKILESGRIRWFSFGSPVGNLAFVNAARTSVDGKDRCLLELANLSTIVRQSSLLIDIPSSGRALSGESIRLEPGRTHRIILDLPKDCPQIVARIDDAVLDIDNEVILLPEIRRSIRVEVRISDPKLRDLVERAALASGRAVIVDGRAELVFTDQSELDYFIDPGAWAVQFVAEADSAAYLGPFVVDRNHPLTNGLSLGGLIVSAGKGEQFPGRPVITAGNVPLLTDTVRPNGRHDIRLRFRCDLSTLHLSPSWPILIWNILEFRGLDAPGLRRGNYRLGSDVVLTTGGDSTEVDLTGPDGAVRKIAVAGRSVNIAPGGIGLHTIGTPGGYYSFAVNALSRSESDLSGCALGRWGSWSADESLGDRYRSVMWLFVVAALAVLLVHMALIRRQGPRGFGI